MSKVSAVSERMKARDSRNVERKELLLKIFDESFMYEITQLIGDTKETCPVRIVIDYLFSHIVAINPIFTINNFSRLVINRHENVDKSHIISALFLLEKKGVICPIKRSGNHFEDIYSLEVELYKTIFDKATAERLQFEHKELLITLLSIIEAEQAPVSRRRR